MQRLTVGQQVLKHFIHSLTPSGFVIVNNRKN